jgi:hypothetical protein
MLNCCVIRLPALAAVAVLVWLALGILQPVQAQDKNETVHLQVALYEIREAKLDVKAIKGITEKYRDDLFGTLDAASDAIKKCIKACGEESQYVPPIERPYYPNFPHLRHAINELKHAREDLKTIKGVPEDLRTHACRLIDQSIEQFEKALDYVKK